jgi:hypothetical protein
MNIVNILISALISTPFAAVLVPEIRTRLERLPCAMVEMAIRRLPEAEQPKWRERLVPELDAIPGELPVTRLLRGLGFSMSLLWQRRALESAVSGETARPLTARIVAVAVCAAGAIVACGYVTGPVVAGVGWLRLPPVVGGDYRASLEPVICMAMAVGLLMMMAARIGGPGIGSRGGLVRVSLACASVFCGICHGCYVGGLWLSGQGHPQVLVIYLLFTFGPVTAGIALLTRRIKDWFLSTTAGTTLAVAVLTNTVNLHMGHSAARPIFIIVLQLAGGPGLAMMAFYLWRNADRHPPAVPRASADVAPY